MIDKRIYKKITMNEVKFDSISDRKTEMKMNCIPHNESEFLLTGMKKIQDIDCVNKVFTKNIINSYSLNQNEVNVMNYDSESNIPSEFQNLIHLYEKNIIENISHVNIKNIFNFPKRYSRTADTPQNKCISINFSSFNKIPLMLTDLHQNNFKIQYISQSIKWLPENNQTTSNQSSIQSKFQKMQSFTTLKTISRSSQKIPIPTNSEAADEKSRPIPIPESWEGIRQKDSIRKLDSSCRKLTEMLQFLWSFLPYFNSTKRRQKCNGKFSNWNLYILFGVCSVMFITGKDT